MPQTVVVTGMSMALRNEYTERAKRVLLAQARPRDLPFLSATVGYLYLCCGFFFGTAARGALQDVKRERPTSRFAAV